MDPQIVHLGNYLVDLLVIFVRISFIDRLWDAFWSTLGSLVASFGSLWLSFGSLWRLLGTLYVLWATLSL